MLAIRTLLIFGCLFLATGCTPNPRRNAAREVREIGAARLRQDAARVYKDTFAAHGRPAYEEVWYKDWPPSFQKLHPLHVGAYLDGISISLQVREGSESGLYIVPATMDREPASVNGAKFERIAAGVFWYSFPATAHAAPPSEP